MHAYCDDSTIERATNIPMIAPRARTFRRSMAFLSSNIGCLGIYKIQDFTILTSVLVDHDVAQICYMLSESSNVPQRRDPAHPA